LGLGEGMEGIGFARKEGREKVAELMAGNARRAVDVT